MMTIAMHPDKFFALPEYSLSLPTGTAIGKQWRAHRMVHRRERACFEAEREHHDCGHWILGEYVESKVPGRVDIIWMQVILADVTPRSETKQLTTPVRPTWCPEED